MDSASVIDNPEHTTGEISPAPSFDGNGAGNAGHRDRVAMRAYELYLARGGRDGADFDDWLAAEREIGGRQDDLPDGDAGE